MITYEADKTLSPYQNLANAIVAQACDDYRKLLRGKSIYANGVRCSIRGLKKFFRSEYFSTLTKVSGECLIEALDKEFQEERSNPDA